MSLLWTLLMFFLWSHNSVDYSNQECHLNQGYSTIHFNRLWHAWYYYDYQLSKARQCFGDKLLDLTFLISTGNNINPCNFLHFSANNVKGWQVASRIGASCHDNNKNWMLKRGHQTFAIPYSTDNRRTFQTVTQLLHVHVNVNIAVNECTFCVLNKVYCLVYTAWPDKHVHLWLLVRLKKFLGVVILTCAVPNYVFETYCVYNCEDQSCLHFFLCSSNKWSFIYSNHSLLYCQ